MAILSLLVLPLFGQTWVMQESGTQASLRGVSAVNERIAWASGSGGTWLRTLDGGAHWRAAVVPGEAALDFRGVRAVNARTAYLMSSGTGEKSRVYKTTDGGKHWNLLFTNPDPKGFFDAIACWDAKRCMVAGDSVNQEMAIFTTSDGGQNWTRRHTPPALDGEGAFAAGNSCLAVRGKDEAWFGTGAARVFHSVDGGVTWSISATPVRHDSTSAGIFSLAFSGASRGIAVGGDYKHDMEARGNMAQSSDGGASWSAPSAEGPHGFRSAVAWVADRKVWIATGTSGSDISRDGGMTWINFDPGAFNAISGHWAVGPAGRIAVLKIE